MKKAPSPLDENHPDALAIALSRQYENGKTIANTLERTTETVHNETAKLIA